MKEITFITGNQSKADYLAKYLGIPVKHLKLDLDELQSLSLEEIVEHKVRQAFEIVKGPVIVEDVSLEFESMGKLPGPFIKFFLEQMSEQDICNLLNGKKRNAKASCVFGFFDGEVLQLFRGGLNGTVPETPRGDNGFGWDRIFIPEGYDITRAEMGEVDNEKTYTTIKPFQALKSFLESQSHK